MATFHRKILTSDTASESLSFADLLSVQDLRSNSPRRLNHARNHNRESEFSFSTTEFTANNLNRMVSANTSISNGCNQIQLQAFLRQSSNAQKPGSRAVIRRSNKKFSDEGRDEVKVHVKMKQRGRNPENKECSGSSPSIGKKIFQSFLSPCRECHARKPDTLENSNPGKIVRAY